MKKTIIFILLILTVVFQAQFVSAQAGTAMVFDGATTYVDVADDPAFDMSAVTIEMWFYWNAEWLSCR